MRKALLLTAAVLALTAGQALAKKQLVIVVKGLDNPFFEAINQGCQKWNKENPTA
ncbi:sugar ABC transporter substrate-binding protein, partial [Rhizobium ruizarguesonis]